MRYLAPPAPTYPYPSPSSTTSRFAATAATLDRVQLRELDHDARQSGAP